MHSTHLLVMIFNLVFQIFIQISILRVAYQVFQNISLSLLLIKNIFQALKIIVRKERSRIIVRIVVGRSARRKKCFSDLIWWFGSIYMVFLQLWTGAFALDIILVQWHLALLQLILPYKNIWVNNTVQSLEFESVYII